MRLPTLALTVVLVVQTSSVSARDPSVDSQSLAWRSPTIRFETTSFPDAREGYVALKWNENRNDGVSHDFTALMYVVRDQNAEPVYRGALPMAFLSGLADGDYQFYVESLDVNGRVLSRTENPAMVRVRHWSPLQTAVAFAVGAVVFFSLIVVIWHGSVRARGSQSG